MDWTILLWFVAGLILLIAGAEGLVRGASRLAAAFGISPLVIGLTVVAFGTGSPEIAVSIGATLSGEGDIALGNVIGSNICNVLFVLGISAAILPLMVAQRLVRLDVPVMIGVSVLVLLLALDGVIGRLDGLLLVAGIIVYTSFLIWQSRTAACGEAQHPLPSTPLSPQQEKGADSKTPADRPRGIRPVLQNLLMIAVGLGLLIVGANWLVDGAVALASWLGISELVIGLTVIAAGTSLPEVATSVVAALRGQRDIAVGNAVGSNIFNLLAVLGLAGLVAPEGIPVAPSVLWFDLPVMIAVALACLPIFFTGYCIARWEGLLFLAYYIAYTSYLVLAALEHDALSTFNLVMVAFVLPITALTLVLLTWRARKLS